MLKKISALGVLLLTAIISIISLRPLMVNDATEDLSQFSVTNAYEHVKQIAYAPHFSGNPNHDLAIDYIVKSLSQLGLSPEIQEGFSHNPKWNSVVFSKNIIARIKGQDNSKALMLLSHYDSNPHSAPGASDAATGVATILEGLRAYLHTGKTPKNDLIILFTDNEELGLNGAHLFVEKHPWAKDIGLILNFEARGTTGPSYMLLETNGGNQNLLKGFIKANPKFPVANSLAYSIYKMLPNDTDLTPFREIGNIEGFNFAFIDDHFNYHTALDNIDRVDPRAIKHQGSYLMPLLNYFSEADLSVLKSENNEVYINLPFVKMLHYSYLWITPLWIIACLIFGFLLLFGIYKRRIIFKQVCIGFAPLVLVILINYCLGVYGWKFLLAMYPEYQEILHNFPYNGHYYIWSFVILAAAFCFGVYNYFFKIGNTASLLVAPIFFWLIINGLIAFELKGASFLILPVYCTLILWGLLIKNKQVKIEYATLLAIPLVIITFPFLEMFPIGLGLNNLFTATVLVSLMFTISIGSIHYFKKRHSITVVLILISVGLFILAHAKSNFNDERPKPNSLIYFFNTDTQKAYWLSYDLQLDGWNKSYFTNDKITPVKTTGIQTPGSKYNTLFAKAAQANIKVLKQIFIEKLKDSVMANSKKVTYMLSSQREANKIDVLIQSEQPLLSVKANGVSIAIKPHNPEIPQKLFSFFISDNNPLELEINYNVEDNPSLVVYEIAHDLFKSELFKIAERPSHMIPKPFVVNDASIIKSTLKIE